MDESSEPGVVRREMDGAGCGDGVCGDEEDMADDVASLDELGCGFKFCATRRFETTRSRGLSFRLSHSDIAGPQRRHSQWILLPAPGRQSCTYVNTVLFDLYI